MKLSRTEFYCSTSRLEGVNLSIIKVSLNIYDRL